MEVVGEAADGEEALEMALSSRPDIILTDVRMPFMDGLTLMERLRSKMPECGFIVLSGHNEFEYARQAIRQGAFGVSSETDRSTGTKRYRVCCYEENAGQQERKGIL